MKLTGFRVKDFRSVNDSSSIKVSDKTALVGRNESGKTNLLLALEALNPPDGMQPLSFAKDFPRHRMKSEFSETLTVVETSWQLTPAEQESLTSVFPRAAGVSTVRVGRQYADRRWVDFDELPSPAVPSDASKAASSLVRSIQTMQATSADTSAKDAAAAVERAVQRNSSDPTKWATEVTEALTSLKKRLTELNAKPIGVGAKSLSRLSQLARHLKNDEQQFELDAST